MKPYPQKNLSIAKRLFHYRLSGQEELLKMDLEFLLADSESFIGKNLFNLRKCYKIVLCCCVVHNMLRALSNNSYSAIGYANIAGDNGNIDKGS